jgi:hypothetical protein
LEARRELQLHVESSVLVPFVDFKSYLMYLQPAPLETLHNTLFKAFDPQFAKNAVVVHNLPPAATEALVTAIFAELPLAIRVIYSVPADDDAKLPSQALVCLISDDDIQVACSKNGATVLDNTIVVEPFETKHDSFPSSGQRRNPSKVAQGLGKVIASAKDFNTKHGITHTVKKSAVRVAERAGQFADEHKIGDKWDKTKSATRSAVIKIDSTLKISQTVSTVDEKLQISTRASAVADKVASNPHVQHAAGWLSGMAGRVSTAVRDFAADTEAVVAAERRVLTPPPDVELAEAEAEHSMPALVNPHADVVSSGAPPSSAAAAVDLELELDLDEHIVTPGGPQ